MENFEIPVQSVINELINENRRLVLEASTLRAAIVETRARAEELSSAVNGNSVKLETEEEKS